VICHEVQQCGVDGVMHDATYVYQDGHTEQHDICIEKGKPEVTLAMVENAWKEVPLPTPALDMYPVHAATWVNIPAVFFTSADPFSKDLRILSQDVHLEIKPVSYHWEYGQGGSADTDWPGRPYQDGVSPIDNPDSYVSYNYQNTGEASATVTVVWAATYSVNGGTTHEVPTTVPMTSDPLTVAIGEGHPVLY